MTSLLYSTIAEIRECIRAKKISPVEVVAAHLERSAALQPKLNAFVHIDEQAAREQARRAEPAVLCRDELGSLHGVPVSVKSCIDVAGWPCPAGSLLRKSYVASQDAVLVAPLKPACPIVIRNTNTPAFLNAYYN